MSEHLLRVDWPACKAHGVCAEFLDRKSVV